MTNGKGPRRQAGGFFYASVCPLSFHFLLGIAALRIFPVNRR